MPKIKVAIVFGGKSTEHEVALQSARSIVTAIDKEKYEIHLLGIDKTGKWHLNDPVNYLINPDDPKLVKLNTDAPEVILLSDGQSVYITEAQTGTQLGSVDVVFPVIHGAYGEDGTLQGVLRALELPFVGVDILASAVGMDKDMAKRLWRDAGIPIARFFTYHKHQLGQLSFETVSAELGLPLFVKPANAGSSVGVSKVSDAAGYEKAIDEAFRYDRKILIEEAIVGKEVECSVLGNEDPQASVIGEIVPTRDFYSYEAKYIDADGAIMKIPADITSEVSDDLRAAAIKAFSAIGGEGLSRVDFFLKADNTFVLNEINTLPGFTKISMYPKLWEATGLLYPDLIDKLIDLALERHKTLSALKTVN
jgi:D-alanine-D-alanine ligase